MKVIGFGIARLIRVGEAFTGKIKLTFQQIKISQSPRVRSNTPQVRA